MLLLSSILLAVSFATSDNGEFFTLPDWMPRAVDSTVVPGSSDYDSHSNLTTNDAAAIYAIYDSYCERLYYLNKGMRDNWKPSEYGPIEPTKMIFPVVLPHGRTNTVTRSIYGLENMAAFTRGNMKFDSLAMYRPSWACDRFAISSSFIRIGENALLDDGIMPSGGWTTDYASLGASVRTLYNFKPDGVFNIAKHPGGWTDLFVESCIADITHGGNVVTTNNGITVTFQEAMTNNFAEGFAVEDIFTTTNAILKAQPWMVAASRYFVILDRSYAANRAGTPAYKQTTKCGCSRSSAWDSVSGNTITVSDDGSAILATSNIIAKSEWDVSGLVITNETLAATNYTGVHAAEIAVTEVGFRRTATASSALAFGVGGTYTVADFITDISGSSVGSGDISFVFWSQKPNAYEVKVNGATDISYHEYVGDFGITNITVGISVERAYDWTQTIGNTASIADRLRPDKDAKNVSSVIGSIVVYDADSTNREFMALRGDKAGYNLTNDINSVVTSCKSEMTRLGKQEWGDYETPQYYATVYGGEARANGVIENGSLGLDYRKGTFTATYDSAAGTLSNIKYVDGAVTNTISAGTADPTTVLNTIVGGFVPNVRLSDWEKEGEEHPARSAIGNACAIQQQTFDFKALGATSATDIPMSSTDAPWGGPSTF